MKKYIGLIILILSIIITFVLIDVKDKIEPEQIKFEAPFVRTQKISIDTAYAYIQSHGIIIPQEELILLSELNARVKWLSNKMKTGLSFRKGDTLIKLDSRDYELALILKEVHCKINLIPFNEIFGKYQSCISH